MTKGTETKKLSDLYQIGSSKRVLKSEWKASGVPFYRGREVTQLAAYGAVDNELFISEAHFAELSKEYGVPKAGDIVITAIGTIGNSHVVRDGDRFYFKDASVLWMKRTADVSSEFVNLWLKSPFFFDQLDRGNGATVDTLTIQRLKSVELRLPPLDEQQRIVRILDEAFEGIVIAKANAERNVQNARALFESYVRSVFARPAKEWLERTLGDLATFRNGINFTSSSRGKSVQIVGVKNFQDNFHVPLDDLERVTIDGSLSELDTLKENDILFVRSNGNIELIGRCLLVGPVAREITHSGFTIRARLNDNAVNPRFLCYFLKSQSARREMVDRGIGTNIKSLNQQTLSALVVPLPSLVEQIRIVSQLESLKIAVQRLESIYEQKLTAVEAMRRSFLHLAFAGEL